MIDYPEILKPTATEQIGDVHVQKAQPTFQVWQGEPVAVDDEKKALINMNGEPVYAEIAILRLFEADGWEGVWLDTYYRRYRVSIHEDVELPESRFDLLNSISKSSGGRFDVFCWKGDQVIFAEAKRQGDDSVRDSQAKWLAVALDYGLPLESFMIVEWELAGL